MTRRGLRPAACLFLTSPGLLAHFLLYLAGLIPREDLSPADIQTRYFEGRTDGFYAFEHVHLVSAMVT